MMNPSSSSSPRSIERFERALHKNDSYRFLGMIDVPWKKAIEQSVASDHSDSRMGLPTVFTDDPFAWMAIDQKNFLIHELIRDAHQFNEVKPAHELSARLDVIRIGKGTTIEWVHHQYSTTSLHQQFSRLYFEIESDAHLNLTVIQSGMAKSQVRVHVAFKGQNAAVSIHGLTLGKGSERQDLWVDCIHDCPHTSSTIHSWCAVKDRAHSVFNGNVTITDQAPFTETAQKNKNLILSKTATVDAFPKLLIAHNEVKASHGSSVSTLEPDQLWYLQSRGIDQIEAERMLTQALIQQALEWIQTETTVTSLKSLEAWV